MALERPNLNVLNLDRRRRPHLDEPILELANLAPRNVQLLLQSRHDRIPRMTEDLVRERTLGLGLVHAELSELRSESRDDRLLRSELRAKRLEVLVVLQQLTRRFVERVLHLAHVLRLDLELTLRLGFLLVERVDSRFELVHREVELSDLVILGLERILEARDVVAQLTNECVVVAADGLLGGEVVFGGVELSQAISDSIRCVEEKDDSPARPRSRALRPSSSPRPA